MNQIPSVPNPYMVPQQKFNAVNIEISNPSVGGAGMPQCGVPQAPQAPQADAGTYTAPIYNYPQAQGPIYYPPVNQPVFQPPVIDAPAEAQSPAQQVPQPPVVPAPAVEQQNVNVPAEAQQTAPAAQAPEAVATAPVEAKPEAPEVVPSESIEPQVDMNAFIAKLTNPDFDVQAAGMEDISHLVNNSPEKATELVDSKVFDALTNIINFDSSNLPGLTPEQEAAKAKDPKDRTPEEQALVDQSSPKDKAERNKCYALFSSALMQKIYGDEVARLSNSTTTVPLTELPGAMTVVDNLKDNPNPVVRASAIEALSYIQNPAYKKDLETIFTIAKNDQDAGVAATAQIALDKLNNI